MKSENLSPGILSMLPMFYVGWSDSVLSPTEMKMIHEQIDSMYFLTKEDKEYLIRWTDPTRPPSQETFKEWASILKEQSSKLPVGTRDDLAKLGLEIAQAHTGYKSDSIWKSPKTQSALTEVAEALGVSNSNSTSILFGFNETEGAVATEDPGFKSDDLKRYLDGEHGDLKDKLRKLLRDPIFKYELNPDKEYIRNRTLLQTKELAKQGVSAYSFPKKYGGFDRKGDHIVVFEMLGYGDLSLAIKFGVQFGLFGGAVFMLGTKKHHEKYLEAMSKAELLGCFAMTETGHGSNVRGLETTATYNHDTDEIIVHTPNRAAGKEYIGNALHSSMAAVFAQLIVDGQSQGVHAVLVPMRDDSGKLLDGVELEDCGYKMGLNGVDNGRIWFNQVRVPRENLLDKYGSIDRLGRYDSPIGSASKRFFTMLGALVVGRICVGLAGISTSKVALNIAIKYALKRRQFGFKDGEQETLILDYPSHQHRLFPLLAKTYGYYFALRDLADQYTNLEEGGDVRHIETLAAGLKSKATWHCTETTQVCREACGGKGYLSENRFTNLKGDSDIFTTFEGDNTVLMQLVAKGLLTDFKQVFHDEGYRAVIKYLYNRFSNRMTEMNPVHSRNTNAAHLLGREFHMHAFDYRQEKLLISLSQRMQNFLKRRLDPSQAFLKCQNHMIALAHGYIDNVVLKSYYRAIDNCEDSHTKAALQTMCNLYALTIIDEEKGWFLEADYMEGAKTKAIRRMISKLYQEIRPDAEKYVDAFAIPEELVGAQIILG